jgi:hypothetical protein
MNLDIHEITKGNTNKISMNLPKITHTRYHIELVTITEEEGSMQLTLLGS